MSFDPLVDRAAELFRDLQERVILALEALDGGGRFQTSPWRHHGSGGGRTCILEGGDLFEKAGVNFSDLGGSLTGAIAKEAPGDGPEFRATGISLVLHPLSPMVPSVHANFRCLQRGKAMWFGGGADLTPYYFFREDAVHFHRTWKEVCDRHDSGYYPQFKRACDEYFFLRHRGETRGVGGIFFDHLLAADPEPALAFVREAGEAFLPSYLPIAVRRRCESWGERERRWQLARRGRYVEFNLLYDRGTAFGLETGGRAESILMSLPAVCRWPYDLSPEPGSREAELLAWLTPTEWLAAAGEPEVGGQGRRPRDCGHSAFLSGG